MIRKVVKKRKEYLAARRAAAGIASQHLAEVMTLDYDTIVDRYSGDGVQLVTSDGDHREHQVDIGCFPDDGKSANMRVFVSVDDGGWMAFMPPCDSDFVTPSNEHLKSD